MGIRIDLNKEFFDKNSEEALEQCFRDIGEKTSYDFGDRKWDNNEPCIEFSNGKLTIYGSNETGFCSMEVDLDLDTVVDIIDFYMKKLGKIKTVIEASK